MLDCANILQDLMPARQRVLAREIVLQHLSGPAAHVGDLGRVLGQCQDRRGEACAVALSYDPPASEFADQISDLTGLVGQRQDWFAGRGNAVELARDDQPGQLGS